MPLIARLRDDHYPRDERSPGLDYHIVLSGGLEVGGYHRIGSGPSEGRWLWGAWLGSATGPFTNGGYATHPDVCQTLIGLAFRRMLARADLREHVDAKPSPSRRAPADPRKVERSAPGRPYDCDSDRMCGWMIRDELSKSVRSGELTVGLLTCAHGPERWFWSLAGLPRPDENYFEWRGEVGTEKAAFDALTACWSQWLAWAGLEQIAPLQRG